MAITIRPASPDDGPRLQEIERIAGEQFRDVGLPGVADDEPFTLDDLAEYATDGRAWVALDDAERPVGYAVVDDVDGNAHLEQVSVMPDHQGSGVGRALIERVEAWARASGRRAVTLTSFTNVAWNAPLYQHLGFRVLTEGELGPELRAVRDAETEHGLDPTARVCMRRDLGG